MKKYHSHFHVESASDIERLTRSLGHLHNFKKQEVTPTSSTITVGSKFKLLMWGTILNNEYTAPVRITLKKTSTGADVSVDQNYPLPLYNISSLREFYDNTTSKVRELLSAA